MPERAACVAAERVLQRAVVGTPLRDDELTKALDHMRSCPFCSRRFELAAARAYWEERDTVPAMADSPVEATALFERALTAALSDPEAIARRRAAQRLGDFQRLGPAALAALARRAADDRDETVRAAALTALDRLDDELSLPQRLIDTWSETPAEAAPYLADVLARLSDPAALASSRVTLLVAEKSGAWNRLTVRGEAGALGEIVRKDDQWWMKLNRLPGMFEKTKPVVAFPAALEAGETQIEWSGESPGLVFSREPVSEGALDVFLGNVHEPGLRRALSGKVFSRVYLLNPREHAGGF